LERRKKGGKRNKKGKNGEEEKGEEFKVEDKSNTKISRGKKNLK
jgi:hypothetical protein